jgi:hypothetical protein
MADRGDRIERRSLLEKTLDGELAAREPAEAELAPLLSALSAGREEDAYARACALLEDSLVSAPAIAAFTSGTFRREGPASLEALFASLSLAVGPRWNRVGREDTRGRHFESAVCSALRDIASVWQFSIASGAPPWPAIDRATALSALRAATAFRSAASERYEEPRFSVHVSSVESLLRSALETARAPVAIAPATPQIRVEEDEEAPPRRVDRSPSPEPEASVRTSAVREDPGSREHPLSDAVLESDTVTLEVTPALRALFEKLDAFEALIERDEHLRAAIVAADVQRELDAFDPRRYFPRLFAAHIARRVERRADLSLHARDRGGDEWNDLEELYRVDLDAFVRG